MGPSSPDLCPPMARRHSLSADGSLKRGAGTSSSVGRWDVWPRAPSAAAPWDPETRRSFLGQVVVFKLR